MNKSRSSKMASVNKSAGKMRPMSMKEYERSPMDKAADKKALKGINSKRRGK